MFIKSRQSYIYQIEKRDISNILNLPFPLCLTGDSVVGLRSFTSPYIPGYNLKPVVLDF